MVTATTTQKIWARLASLQQNLERLLAFRSILVAAGQLRKKSGSFVVFEYWVRALSWYVLIFGGPLASRCTTLTKLTCLQYLAFLSISYASIFGVACEVWKHTCRRHFDAVSSQCTGLSFHQYQRNVAKDERVHHSKLGTPLVFPAVRRIFINFRVGCSTWLFCKPRMSTCPSSHPTLLDWIIESMSRPFFVPTGQGCSSTIFRPTALRTFRFSSASLVTSSLAQSRDLCIL